MRYRMLLGLTLLLLAAPAVTQAEDSAPGACPTNKGVTVVVDFRELGGGVGLRCSPGQARDGFDALRRANVSYQTVASFPGFMCRIANKPASDPCQDPAPMRAYWTYWVAERGGRWCPSSNGAGNRTPVQGTFEGWSFSRNKTAVTPPPPRYKPDAPVAGEPTPRLAEDDCTEARGLVASNRTVTTSPLPTIPPTRAPGAPAPAVGLMSPARSSRPGQRSVVAGSGDDAADLAPAESITRRETVAADPLRLRTSSGDDGGSPLPTLVVGGVIGLATLFAVHRRRAAAADQSRLD